MMKERDERIEKRALKTVGKWSAVGPYSPAVCAGPFVFVSGQIGLDAATGQLVEGGVEQETRQALENLKAVLEAAGSSLERVVKTTVFLRDMSTFAAMNAVYAQYFPADPPARSTVQAVLPKGAKVEIDAIALMN